MLVFIDESGDAGLKLDSGSSEYFVVTLVAFTDQSDAQKTDNRISELRDEFGFSSDFEFRFNKLHPKYREAFLREMASHNFFYVSMIVDKAKLDGSDLRYTGSFYQHVCGLVFEHSKSYLSEAIVVIDGSGTREFKRELGTYLKKRVNDQSSQSRYIKKVKIADSKNNNLLQLADMMCGAIARIYKGKSDSKLIREIIACREMHVEFWPK